MHDVYDHHPSIHPSTTIIHFPGILQNNNIRERERLKEGIGGWGV